MMIVTPFDRQIIPYHNIAFIDVADKDIDYFSVQCYMLDGTRIELYDGDFDTCSKVIEYIVECYAENKPVADMRVFADLHSKMLTDDLISE